MKTLYIILGSLSLGLGVAGIFLPILPTTPFLLLTAALYFRGSPRLYDWLSPRLYDWLLRQKRLGPYIRNFREHKAIPLHAKIVSVGLTWLTILYCVAFLLPQVWLKLLLLALAAGISWHILSYKTLK